jgi:hypothetical protein
MSIVPSLEVRSSIEVQGDRGPGARRDILPAGSIRAILGEGPATGAVRSRELPAVRQERDHPWRAGRAPGWGRKLRPVTGRRRAITGRRDHSRRSKTYSTMTLRSTTVVLGFGGQDHGDSPSCSDPGATRLSPTHMAIRITHPTVTSLARIPLVGRQSARRPRLSGGDPHQVAPADDRRLARDAQALEAEEGCHACSSTQLPASSPDPRADWRPPGILSPARGPIVIESRRPSHGWPAAGFGVMSRFLIKRPESRPPGPGSSHPCVGRAPPRADFHRPAASTGPPYVSSRQWVRWPRGWVSGTCDRNPFRRHFPDRRALVKAMVGA